MISYKTKILKLIKIISKTLLILIVVLGIFILFFILIRNRIDNSYKKKTELKLERKISPFLEPSQVKEIQQILKNSDFDPGSIDGVIGNKTRQAIREFQKAKGLEPTGKIDQKTQLALKRQKEKSEQIQKIVPERISKEKSETQNEVMGYRLQSKERTTQIQKALTQAGFYNGEIDGKTGEQTKQAIQEFQKSKGLAVDGVVGLKTWEELNKYLTD